MNFCAAFAGRVFALLLLCALLFFFPIQDVPFANKGEPREGIVVQAIVNEGNWVFPLRPDGRLPSKPPLFHWLGSLASLAYGQTTEATVRFPSALLATFGVLLVYALGRRMFGEEGGFWGAVVLATSFDYHSLGIAARVDMTLAFFVTLSLVLFYFIESKCLSGALWRALFYLTLGLGVLAKGPISFVLVTLVIALFYLQARRWSELRQFFFSRGMLLALAVAGSWYAVALAAGGEKFFHKQILQENLLRFWAAGEEGTGHAKPFYFYVPYLFLNGLPWTLFLPLMILDGWKRRPVLDSAQKFLILWVAGMFLLLSLSTGKRADYLLPLYPAVALLIARWLGTAGEPAEKKPPMARTMGAFFILVGILALLLFWDAARSSGSELLSFVASRLRERERQEVLWVARALQDQRWVVSAILLLFALVSLLAGRALMKGRLRAARLFVSVLAVLALAFAHLGARRAIAENKSYAPFVAQANRELSRGGVLYVYGDGFDKYQITFYHGRAVPALNEEPQKLGQRLRGEDLVILSEAQWRRLAAHDAGFPAPIAKSKGVGPDGDAPLVLIRGSDLKLSRPQGLEKKL